MSFYSFDYNSSSPIYLLSFDKGALQQLQQYINANEITSADPTMQTIKHETHVINDSTCNVS